MEILLEISKLGLVGLISGLFSAYIALRGHRNKRWWELRVSAYQSLIDALSDLSYYYDRKLMAEIQHRELSEEHEADLKTLWDENYHNVRKAADAGAFLFSDTVNEALKKFMALRNEHHDSYFDHLDSYSAITNKCLKVLVKSAKVDLKVEDTWL